MQAGGIFEMAVSKMCVIGTSYSRFPTICCMLCCSMLKDRKVAKAANSARMQCRNGQLVSYFEVEREGDASRDDQPRHSLFTWTWTLSWSIFCRYWISDWTESEWHPIKYASVVQKSNCSCGSRYGMRNTHWASNIYTTYVRACEQKHCEVILTPFYDKVVHIFSRHTLVSSS